MMNPQLKLYTVLIDAFVSIALLLAARYLSPADVQFVRDLVIALQPAVIALIAALAYNEKAHIEAEVHRDVAAIQAASDKKP